MTLFETEYAALKFFLPPLHGMVRDRLIDKIHGHPETLEILDVGGRRSPYTIGVRARVTVTDLPRTTDIQKNLHLGMTEGLASKLKSQRSNIAQVLFDDMTQSKLPSSHFDGVVAVEVLEHVEEDGKFVREVARVLKPGGFFLMTTPNGDFVLNKNPDHKRHYRKKQLEKLLLQHFAQAQVIYAIQSGIFRTWGLKSWALGRPFQTALSMAGNAANWLQSQNENLKGQSQGTCHLIALARRN